MCLKEIFEVKNSLLHETVLIHTVVLNRLTFEIHFIIFAMIFGNFICRQFFPCRFHGDISLLYLDIQIIVFFKHVNFVKYINKMFFRIYFVMDLSFKVSYFVIYYGDLFCIE